MVLNRTAEIYLFLVDWVCPQRPMISHTTLAYDVDRHMMLEVMTYSYNDQLRNSCRPMPISRYVDAEKN